MSGHFCLRPLLWVFFASVSFCFLELLLPGVLFVHCAATPGSNLELPVSHVRNACTTLALPLRWVMGTRGGKGAVVDDFRTTDFIPLIPLTSPGEAAVPGAPFQSCVWFVSVGMELEAG